MPVECFPQVFRLALVATFALGMSACAGGLVKPHQREYLADRIMRPETRAQENAADQHVLTTREGAVGGGGTVGGGCGCNQGISLFGL